MRKQAWLLAAGLTFLSTITVAQDEKTDFPTIQKIREEGLQHSHVMDIAFHLTDASGNRLGYGKGYYDRMLLEMAPPAVVVAVAFEFQLLAEVPTTEGDQPIPTVITDARLIETGAGS